MFNGFEGTHVEGTLGRRKKSEGAIFVQLVRQAWLSDGCDKPEIAHLMNVSFIALMESRWRNMAYTYLLTIFWVNSGS